MAKIDIINIRGNREKGFNLSDTVGMGGINRRDDVTLIQSFFYYLYQDKEAKLASLPFPHPMFAMINEDSVTGILDMLTFQMILFFQSAHRRQLLSVDNIIHPAHYENRVIKDTTEPLMTITYLHLLAKHRELRTGGNYLKSILGIMKLYTVTEVAGAMMRHH